MPTSKKPRRKKSRTAGNPAVVPDGITRLTPSNCERIQRQMLKACRKVAKEHGLVVEEASSRASEAGFYFEPAFRVSIPSSDGTAYNPEKKIFEVLAEEYGLIPDDFGREISDGKERFVITGIDPKRPRYPISVKRIPDGRGFKFAPENVCMLLKARRTS